MKNIIKGFLLIVSATFVFAACRKFDSLPNYAKGTVVTLSANVTSVTAMAADSNQKVLTLNWTNPHYATDSSTQKFIIEIDSTGRNFIKENKFEVNGSLSTSFTGSQLNNVFATLGFAQGQTVSIDIRVTSSYANNNEQYLSNVITIMVTPYAIPIKLTPSSSAPLVLQISKATGNAVSFNWNATAYGSNAISYALQMDTVGGSFKSPQTFQLGTATNNAFTENDLNTAAINAGVIGGTTKTVEFRVVSYLGTSYNSLFVYSDTVKLSLTTYIPVPPALYIVGDATPGGWSNPVATPSQQLTKIDAVSFGGIINLTAGKSYLFLPVNGSWDHKYGGTSATGGKLLSDNAEPGTNTPAPLVTGLYKIVVNFQTNSYTVIPYTGTPLPANLYMVGNATPGGWNNPVPTPSQQFTQIDNASFQLTTPLTGGNQFLFLPVNGSWDNKYAGPDTDDSGTNGPSPFRYNASNNFIGPSTDGTYVVAVNFLTNTFTVTPQ